MSSTKNKSDEPSYELCHPQRRVWFSELLHPGTGIGNLAGCVHFPGRVEDLPLLGQAIGRAIASHDALRLQLARSRSSTPRQYVVHTTEEAFETLAITPDRADLKAESAQPFVLYDSPLYLFRLLTGPEGRIGFFFKYHHIIIDALSVSLLNGHIYATFRKLVDGHAMAAAAPPSFLSFLEQEREYLCSADYHEDEAFWHEKLGGVDASVCDLPSARSVQTRRYEHTFDEGLSRDVWTFCAEHDTTVFRFFVSIFALSFSQRWGRSELVISTGHHNRIGAGQMAMAGMTVSTVAMPLCVSQDQPFATFVRDTHKGISDCLSHQRYPFDVLAEHLRARGLDPQQMLHLFVNHIPSFDGDYAVERYSPGADLAALNIKINPNQRPRTDPLQICVDVQVELFGARDVAGLFERWEELVRAVLAMPERELRLFESKSEAHRADALRVSEQSCHGDVPEGTILGLLGDIAANRPNAVALWDSRGELTYGELRVSADTLARTLIGHGVCRGDVVAILMDRCAEFVVAALAVMRCGAAYLPLTPQTPLTRVLAIVEDADARLILSEKPRDVPGFAGTLLVVDRDGAEVDNARAGTEGPTLPLVEGKDLAYVIYTSGTTGAPKGVQLTHRGLKNLCLWCQQICSLSGRDVAAAYCSFMFDVSVAEIFVPLSCGAAVHILPSEARRSIQQAHRFFVDHEVSVATLPTKVGELYQTTFASSPLRVLIVAGEKLRIYRPRGYQLINAYGPTEATVYATAGPVTSGGPPIPIGKPGPNMCAYVVDRCGRLVAPGQQGELWLAGPQVAAGYLGRPDLSAQAFATNPFSEEAGFATVYKTGDGARFLADGQLEFLGRRDRQLKIRGFRVEPAEIEAMAEAHPCVSRCAVLMIGEGKNAALSACYVTAEPLAEKELRAFLEARLPPYMVPKRLVGLSEIRLTPQGKTDIHWLAQKAQSQGVVTPSLSPPRTDTEARLLGLWRKVLGDSMVGVDSDFFDWGGDSLQAMTLFVEIEQTFGQRLPVSVIFEKRTVAHLAAALESTEAPSESLPLIRRGKGAQSLFCVHDFTGDVMPYTNLSAHLDLEVSLYGVRYHNEAKAATIEELAAGYVRAIRAIKPHGPYYLLGYSIGGTIAFEMARQLSAVREDVPLLVLIDTPNYVVHRGFVDSFRFAAAKHVLSWYRGMSLMYKALFVYSNVRRRLTARTLKGLFLPQQQMREMIRRYRPGRWAGPAALIKAEQRLFDIDEALGWRTVASDLRVFQVAGDHISILNKTNARQVAATVGGLLWEVSHGHQ